MKSTIQLQAELNTLWSRYDDGDHSKGLLREIHDLEIELSERGEIFQDNN